MFLMLDAAGHDLIGNEIDRRDHAGFCNNVKTKVTVAKNADALDDMHDRLTKGGHVPDDAECQKQTRIRELQAEIAVLENGSRAVR